MMVINYLAGTISKKFFPSIYHALLQSLLRLPIRRVMLPKLTCRNALNIRQPNAEGKRGGSGGIEPSQIQSWILLFATALFNAPCRYHYIYHNSLTLSDYILKKKLLYKKYFRAATLLSDFTGYHVRYGGLCLRKNSPECIGHICEFANISKIAVNIR